MIDEISNSIAEAVRKRTASATLGTYLFFWAAYHWEGLYVTFFVDQEHIYKSQNHRLKNEYVNEYFFGLDGWNDWNFYLGIIVPAVLTYLFIWWLPYLLLKMYKKEQWFKVEKRIIRLEQEKKVQEDRKELAKETTKAIQEETKVVQAKSKVAKIDPTIGWSEEYERFKKNKLFKDFAQIIESVYTRSGNIRYNYSAYTGTYEFEIPRSALVYADTNGLVALSEDKKKLDFTEKGRYFVRRYTEES